MAYRTFVVIAAFVLTSATCLGDVILTTDGRVFTGLVLGEDRDSIDIDTMINGIRTKLHLRRVEVDTIFKEPIPEGYFSGTPSTSQPASPAAQRDPTKRYLEVPIRGPIDPKIHLRALRACINSAKQKNAGIVVFLIDSRGGDDATGEQLAALISENRGKLRFIAVVDHATSASLWVMCACDQIFVDKSSMVGNGPVRKRHANLGDTKVSIDEAASQQKSRRLVDLLGPNHPMAQAMIAMVEPIKQLLPWMQQDGKQGLSISKPDVPGREYKPPLESARQCQAPWIDSEWQLDKCDGLVLTGETLHQFCGLGYATTSDGAGVSLGVSDWESVGNAGFKAMENSHEAEQKPAPIHPFDAEPRDFDWKVRTARLMAKDLPGVVSLSWKNQFFRLWSDIYKEIDDRIQQQISEYQLDETDGKPVQYAEIKEEARRWIEHLADN